MWGLSPSRERTWDLQDHQTQLAHGWQAATWASCFSITMFGNSAFLAPEASFRQCVSLPLVSFSLLKPLCFSLWTLLCVSPLTSVLSLQECRHRATAASLLRLVRPAPCGLSASPWWMMSRGGGGSPQTVHSLVQRAVSGQRFMRGIQDQTSLHVGAGKPIIP